MCPCNESGVESTLRIEPVVLSCTGMRLAGIVDEIKLKEQGQECKQGREGCSTASAPQEEEAVGREPSWCEFTTASERRKHRGSDADQVSRSTDCLQLFAAHPNPCPGSEQLPALASTSFTSGCMPALLRNGRTSCGFAFQASYCSG